MSRKLTASRAQLHQMTRMLPVRDSSDPNTAPTPKTVMMVSYCRALCKVAGWWLWRQSNRHCTPPRRLPMHMVLA